jgi:single-stranded DNA-binding protein
VYAEGRLSLNTWTGKDGVDRTGLNIRATHIEVMA